MIWISTYEKKNKMDRLHLIKCGQMVSACREKCAFSLHLEFMETKSIKEKIENLGQI